MKSLQRGIAPSIENQAFALWRGGLADCTVFEISQCTIRELAAVLRVASLGKQLYEKPSGADIAYATRALQMARTRRARFEQIQRDAAKELPKPKTRNKRIRKRPRSKRKEMR